MATRVPSLIDVSAVVLPPALLPHDEYKGWRGYAARIDHGHHLIIEALRSWVFDEPTPLVDDSISGLKSRI